MRSFLRALAGALVLVASLAHAGVQRDDALDPGHGAVLLTVSVDYPSFANENALAQLIPQLTVERVDAGAAKPQRYVLEKRLVGLQSGRAYAGSLPAGRYRIHDLMGSNCRLWCGDDGVSMPKAGDLAEFTVEAGRVRWLGSVFVAVHAPVKPATESVVDWAYTDTPDAAIGRRLLAGLYPELASAAPGDMQLGWEPDIRGPAASAAARDKIRRHGSGLFDASPFGKDGFVFGAKYGVVKRWTRADGARLLDTGSPFLLRTVVHGGNGRLLAGGEATTLRYSSDEGRTWTDVANGLPYGLVLQIEALGNDEVVFALQHGAAVSLYRGKLGDSAWTKLGEWPLEFKLWTGMPGAQPDLFVQGRRVALTLPSKRGVLLDLDAGTTHDITPPGSIALFSFSADGVMRCTCVRSIAANPWDSHDLGKTWVDSPIDRWMLLPVFRDPQVGFSYKGALFSKNKTAVMQTRDGGRTWTASRPPTEGGWWRPAYSADGTVMLLSGIALVDKDIVEQVHWSADEATTWNLWVNQGQWLHEPTGG